MVVVHQRARPLGSASLPSHRVRTGGSFGPQESRSASSNRAYLRRRRKMAAAMAAVNDRANTPMPSGAEFRCPDNPSTYAQMPKMDNKRFLPRH